MNNIAKFIVLIFIIINFSLAAQQPSIMHIVLKINHFPKAIKVKTEVVFKLNQWVALSDFDLLTHQSFANSEIPFGVVKHVPCHDRSLIFWRLFRNKMGILLNELLLFNNCKVLSDIKWRQMDKLNRPVHIKTQYIDAITTLIHCDTCLKPSRRFSL